MVSNEISIEDFVPLLMSGFKLEDLLLQARDSHDYKSIVFLSNNISQVRNIEKSYELIKDLIMD